MRDFEIDPITVERQPSLADRVADSLRDAILKGQIKPGAKLVQEDLAGRLGVSRQPLREAFRRLEAEGILENHPRRGMVVREYTEDDVAEIYMLREVLEPHAGALAVQKLKQSDLDRLRSLNEELTAAAEEGDGRLYVELNADFHRTIYEAAGSPRLIDFIEQLWRGYTILTPIFLPGRALRSAEEHAEILDRLSARSSDEVAEALRRHIRRAADDYFAFARAKEEEKSGE